MKRIAIVLLYLISLFFFLNINAQTPTEEWISLGDYIEGNYKWKGKYLVPNYDNDFLYVSKIAFKEPAGDIILPKDQIIINKVDHLESHGYPVVEDNGPIIITNEFDIKQNGHIVKGSDREMNDDGWKIFDLNGIGTLTSVQVKKKMNSKENTIFDHIYVTLDPSKDPKEIKKEMEKAKADKKRMEEERALSSQSLPGLN